MMHTSMADHEATYERLIDRFVAWATEEPGIRAAMIVGSRAREDRPADRWSDLDLIVFADDPASYIDSVAWLEFIGEPVITLVEGTAVGTWRERRVLFAGAVDVDFAFVPATFLEALPMASEDDPQFLGPASVVRRGYRILLDRDGVLEPQLRRMAATKPPPPERPTPQMLEETLNDFWYHCVWIAKKIGRGELYAAHECLDGWQRRLLVRLIRWHASRAGHLWHEVRFLEDWASPHVADIYPSTWARHDPFDIKRAMVAMMDLTSWLGRELAADLTVSIPEGPERAARRWFRELTDEEREATSVAAP